MIGIKIFQFDRSSCEYVHQKNCCMHKIIAQYVGKVDGHIRFFPFKMLTWQSQCMFSSKFNSLHPHLLFVDMDMEMCGHALVMASNFSLLGFPTTTKFQRLIYIQVWLDTSLPRFHLHVIISEVPTNHIMTRRTFFFFLGGQKTSKSDIMWPTDRMILWI